jgi:uncharacterized protein YndB with AHSA1/START domain
MPVDVTTEVLINCPRETVADFAADPENAPRWYANIETVTWRTEPPIKVGSRMDFVALFLGRRLTYTYEVVVLVPGEQLTMRTTEGPFPMSTTYTWEAVDYRTLMRLRNHGEPSGFAAVGSGLLSVSMRRANRKDLDNLKRLLESTHRS